MEIALLVAAVAAALTVVGVYLQRGYQGYLRTASQSQGIQFDPTQPYNSSQRIEQYNRNQSIDVTSEEAGTTRILTSKVRTVTDWDVRRNATYQAQ